MTEILAPLHQKEQLRILGPFDPAKRGGIITIVVPAEQQDSAFRQFEDDAVEANVMYRTGHFCVNSWFNSHSNRLPNRYMAVRFSLYVYNTVSEVEKAASLVAHAFGEH